MAGQTFTDSGTASCVTGDPPGDGTQMTLNPIDGWDSKNLKTLVADARLYTVTDDDLNYFEVESGQFLSLQFDQLSAAGSIKQATLHLTHHEEPTFAAQALVLEAGSGTLNAPTVTAAPFVPAVVHDVTNETTVAWDVSSIVQSSAAANGFKLVVRNTDPGFKKARIDKATLVVTYGP